MSDKNKTVKDDFTSMILEDEVSIAGQDKTEVVPSDLPSAPKNEKQSVITSEDKPKESEQKDETQTLSVADDEKTKQEQVEAISEPILAKKQQDEAKVLKASETSYLVNLEGTLRQSESLDVAQKRILELESEIEKLKIENEKLSSIGVVLQERCDEVAVKLEDLNKEYRHSIEIHKDEKKLLEEMLKDRNKELSTSKDKISDLENRLNERLVQVRVREKELENRVHLLKQEGEVLVSNKNEVILDLKRELDRLKHEVDNHKIRNRDMHKKVEDQKDQMRKTIKALRLALSVLEGEAFELGMKKTGS